MHADDHVGALAGHGHLLHRLLADDRLVQEHVVQHRPQRVLGVVALGRVLDGLRDGDAERSGAVGVLRQDPLAVVGGQAGAGHDLRAVDLHQHAPIRLLVVADAHHVDLDLEAEERAGEREGRAPLAGSCLGRQALHALGLVEVRLGDGRVGLVAAGRTDALVLVVDVGRRLERRLQAVGAIERRRPVEGIGVAHRTGDLDLALGAHFLADEGHGEERREVGGPDRLARAGVQHRGRRRRQVGRDVVPDARDARLIQHELGALLRHGPLLLLGPAAGHRVRAVAAGGRMIPVGRRRRASGGGAGRALGGRRRGRRVPRLHRPAAHASPPTLVVCATGRAAGRG